MMNKRFALLLKGILLLVVLVDAGGPLVSPISDPDLFWHLKNGEWIWENHALPDRFLFVSAPPSAPEVMQRFTMTSYWLTEVLFHRAHAAGGMGAIVGLRFLLFALLLLALFLGKEGDDFIFLGLLAFAGIILREFPAERLQYVSFVFFGFLLILLGGIRSATSPASLMIRGTAVPLLMVVWANCHGGYVVGLGVMAVWLLAESLKQLHPRFEPLPPASYRLLLVSGVAGFLVSLLNPNTYHVFEVALLPAWHTNTVTEYRSTIEIFQFYAAPWILAYWALLGLAVAGLALSWRRPDLTSIALVAITGYFSFTRIRYIPFFVVVAVLVACRQFSAPRLVARARIAFAAAGFAVGLLFLREAAAMYRDSSQCAEANGFQLPVAAAGFIRSEGLQGNMFNLYAWGGYLLWRLAPAEVLLDGRNSDRDLYEGYMLVMRGEGGSVHGLPFWKQYFLTRNIHYTITSFFDGLSGEIHGLMDDLLADPSWMPVFTSPNSVVFAENVPGNRDVILRNALPKEQFYPVLLDYLSGIIAGNTDFVQAYVARGDILLRLGDRAGALRSFEDALRIAPRQPVALARVASLRELAASSSPDR